MTFLEHLNELRSRIFRVLAAWVVAFFVCYPFVDEIFRWLSAPLRQAQEASGDVHALIYTGPLEVFISFMKLGLVAALILVTPYLFWQVWAFVSPGLRAREKRMAIPFVLLTSLFFVAGVGFCFFVVLPLGYEFFLNYAPAYIEAQIRVTEYLSITTRMLLACGILFELPLLVLFFVFLGLVTTAQIARQWRWVILGVCIVSAVLTPADVMTMLLLAIPLMVLFAASLGLGKMIERSRRAD